MMMCPQTVLAPSVQAREVHEPEEVSPADRDTDTVISEEAHELDVWETGAP